MRDARILVRALEALESDVGFAELAVVDDYVLRVKFKHGAVVLGQHHVAGVGGAVGFDTGAYVGRFCSHQRHSLALHVGAHQSAVGIVVLKERDQRGGDRDDLFGGHVHHLDFVGGHR